jgi:hypothetical protein
LVRFIRQNSGLGRFAAGTFGAADLFDRRPSSVRRRFDAGLELVEE